MIERQAPQARLQLYIEGIQSLRGRPGVVMSVRLHVDRR